MPSLSMVTLPLLGVLKHRVNVTAGVGGLAPSSAAGGAYAHISPSWGISPWGSSGGAAAVGQQQWQCWEQRARAAGDAMLQQPWLG